MQKWRNWQTRTVQVRVVEIPCGFDSHLLQAEEKLFDWLRSESFFVACDSPAMVAFWEQSPDFGLPGLTVGKFPGNVRGGVVAGWEIDFRDISVPVGTAVAAGNFQGFLSG